MTRTSQWLLAGAGVALAAGAALWAAGCGQGADPAQAEGPAPARVWVAPGVPPAVRRAVAGAIAADRDRLAAARSRGGAEVRVAGDRSRRPGAGHLAEVVLAPVVPFATVADDVSWASIRRFWRGDGRPLGAEIAPGSAPTLYLTPAVKDTLTGRLGRNARTARIRTVAARRLVDTVWRAGPGAWSIVPFDQLRPRWKVLTLDGRSVLDRGLRVRRYPLVAPVCASGPREDVAVLRRAVVRAGARTNRDPGRMTVLTMTGVTALSRTVASRMESNGTAYPAEKVRGLLRDNDLLHISNEVSFTADCPGPMRGTRFCSDPEYIGLLEDVGADIVELSGNHNLDWGPEAARRTLDMYEKRGWRWFAGGRDDAQARRPLRIAHNGNRLAFLGCNPVGPPYAWAGRGHPGAAACDLPAMARQVRRLRGRGYLPIVTFQHWEAYQYGPTGQQVEDFGLMSAAGAAIVSGSQAHQPQGFAFHGGRLIHYGLGNLFFDQMQTLGTRQGIVDTHVFHRGRHLSTRLSTVLLEDYSQPRPTTPAERAQLLGSVFAASGW